MIKIEEYIDTVSGEKLKKETWWYYESGKVSEEWFYRDEKLHREDGPAIIHYCENGKIKSEFFWVNHKRHRSNGPAAIDYHENGKIEREFYYLEDVECDILQEMVIRGLEAEKSLIK